MGHGLDSESYFGVHRFHIQHSTSLGNCGKRLDPHFVGGYALLTNGVNHQSGSLSASDGFLQYLLHCPRTTFSSSRIWIIESEMNAILRIIVHYEYFIHWNTMCIYSPFIHGAS